MKIKKWIFLIGSIFLFSAQAQSLTKITQIDFLGTKDPQEIFIQGDSALEFETQENEQDKQIILEIKNAKFINYSLGRKLDTSSFESPILLISPYEIKDKNEVRIVIQLREMIKIAVNKENNSLRLSLPAIKNLPPTEPIEAVVAAKEQPLEHVAEEKADRLKVFIDTRSTKRFIGRPIALKFRDADIGDVLHTISEASGFNIVLGDDVKGKISIALVNVPWDLALDTILQTMRLGAERNNNVLRIVTLNTLATEKQEQLRAKQASEAAAPLVTRMFQISYANLSDLQATVSKFSSTAVGGAGGAFVQVDNRTNTLIVRDIAENVDKIKKLIEILDTQTPQVIIEAKIVEASENFKRQINGTLGLARGGVGKNQWIAGFNSGNPLDGLIGGALSGGASGIFSTKDEAGKLSEGGGGFGWSPTISSIIPSIDRLNAILKISEQDNEVKIISAPKTVVLNKEKGSIVSGTPVLVPGTTIIPGVGPVLTTTVQEAKLGLDVKPTVTNDGNVLLELEIKRDIPFPLGGSNTGIATRKLNTSVVVESGSTLVIGGIYTLDIKKNSQGFPFLRKIPIIGWFFGGEDGTNEQTELFIFVTPRIINEKEAGLT
ncbi:MAG: type IV pilus secretin PilQ [Bdellovibrio sp.]|nr:type IV pilus secretin PilQ [Bdellovibrio sp.]